MAWEPVRAKHLNLGYSPEPNPWTPADLANSRTLNPKSMRVRKGVKPGRQLRNRYKHWISRRQGEDTKMFWWGTFLRFDSLVVLSCIPSSWWRSSILSQNIQILEEVQTPLLGLMIQSRVEIATLLPTSWASMSQKTALLLWLILKGGSSATDCQLVHTAKVGLRNNLRLLKRRLGCITPYPVVYIGKMSEPRILGNAAILKTSHI